MGDVEFGTNAETFAESFLDGFGVVTTFDNGGILFGLGILPPNIGAGGNGGETGLPLELEALLPLPLLGEEVFHVLPLFGTSAAGTVVSAEGAAPLLFFVVPVMPPPAILLSISFSFTPDSFNANTYVSLASGPHVGNWFQISKNSKALNQDFNLSLVSFKATQKSFGTATGGTPLTCAWFCILYKIVNSSQMAKTSGVSLALFAAAHNAAYVANPGVKRFTFICFRRSFASSRLSRFA